jgi:hypothetical protein
LEKKINKFASKKKIEEKHKEIKAKEEEEKRKAQKERAKALKAQQKLNTGFMDVDGGVKKSSKGLDSMA